MAYIGQSSVLRLRQDLYSHLLTQGAAFFQRHRTNYLVSRLISSAAAIENAVTYTLRDALGRMAIKGQGSDAKRCAARPLRPDRKLPETVTGRMIVAPERFEAQRFRLNHQIGELMGIGSCGHGEPELHLSGVPSQDCAPDVQLVRVGADCDPRCDSRYHWTLLCSCQVSPPAASSLAD